MIAKKVLMIRPETFRCNEETSESNIFQLKDKSNKPDYLLKAQNEFHNLNETLDKNGICVHTFTEKAELDTPDALFPNNWISFHPDGKIFLYPMLAHNRRRERRVDIVEKLKKIRTHKNQVIIDLSPLEIEEIFLEGTGSLVLDHENKIGFACLSARTHKEAIQVFEKKSGYAIYTFYSESSKSKPIYHTNVMMSIGKNSVVICLESIPSKKEQLEIMQIFERLKKRIIPISLEQVHCFLGNILQLKNNRNEFFWFCSYSAFDCLHNEQKTHLEKDSTLIPTKLDVIQKIGGGGVRCLIAEIY